MKNLIIKTCTLFVFLSFSLLGFSQISSYCAYDKAGNKYQLNLKEGEGTLTYKKYSTSGDLIQTLYGTWELRDEGVYGPTYKIIATISGSKVKWIVVRNGSGQIQQLNDEAAGRVWSPCSSE